MPNTQSKALIQRKAFQLPVGALFKWSYLCLFRPICHLLLDDILHWPSQFILAIAVPRPFALRLPNVSCVVFPHPSLTSSPPLPFSSPRSPSSFASVLQPHRPIRRPTPLSFRAVPHTLPRVPCWSPAGVPPLKPSPPNIRPPTTPSPPPTRVPPPSRRISHSAQPHCHHITLTTTQRHPFHHPTIRPDIVPSPFLRPSSPATVRAPSLRFTPIHSLKQSPHFLKMPLLPLSHQKLHGSRIPTTKYCRGARERRLTLDLGSAMFSSSPASTANLGPSRSQTPTNPMNSVPMNGSFTLTLPREKEKSSPTPKCFGKSTHMLKEDYEKERARWEKKLEEAEQKLSEAAAYNSELFQLKAELNRKIIDFEKSQRPLIEQNRRLNERIKAANGESRKLEEQLAHVQDELLSLKDAYERVQKENAALRELRAFPEKLEELSRYRAQVLEMSKCITALRQSAAEKDRRHELLVMKLKRLRKSALQESDRQSCTAGSEGSVEDSGSIGLDTITEDLDEEVELSAAFAIIGDGRGQNGEFVLLRQQLEMASDAVAELQKELERVREESARRMGEETDSARRELDTARKRERQLEQQLANTTALNDLLEFQLVELTATKQQKESVVRTAEKMCATDVSLPVNDQPIGEEPKKRRTFEGKANSADQMQTTVEGLRKAIRSALLSREEKLAISQATDAIEYLHNKKCFLETELNMAQCEMERMSREMNTKEREWSRQREEVLNERRQKKRELKTELEQLRKEKNEETGAYARQVEELSRSLSAKIHTITDLNDRMAQFGAELDICRCQLSSSQAENGAIKEQIGECLRQKDKAERELGRLRAEAEEAKEKVIRERDERRTAEQKAEKDLSTLKAEQSKDKAELIRLRTYNRELEGQFNAQMEMLGALKRKLLAIKDKEGSTGKGGGGATRSCGSTEDEQYHSEGSDESTANGAGRTAIAKVRWSQN